MMFAINLGTETVRGTRRQADCNMRALCREAGVPPRFLTPD